MRHLISATLFALASLPAIALGSPYELYGASSRGAAQGSAQTASGEGAGAMHHNPSLLATSPIGLSLGIMATFGQPQIRLQDRPDGYDVPDLGAGSRAVATEDTVSERSDTELNEPLVGLRVGVVAPVIVDGLRAGFQIFLPIPTLVTLQTYFPDERERYFSNQLHFERLGRRVHQLDLQFGVAYEVTKWLSVGIGAAYLPSFAVNTGVYLPDPTNQSDADLNADISTENDFGLLAGLRASLPADLSIGVSFRDANVMRVTTDNAIQITGVTNGEPIVQTASWTPIFSPARAALGLAWTPGDWTVSLDGRYTFWSGYEGAQGEDTGFDDIVSVAAGSQWQYSAQTALRFGAGFEPSPVPEQTGRTNYVDNPRVQVSFGAGHRFVVGERDVDISWHVRLQSLLPRTHQKAQLDDYPACAPGVTDICDEVSDELVEPGTDQRDPRAQGLQTGNPGFPGFRSGGWLGSLGVELTY